MEIQKYSNVKISIVDKWINTNRVKFTTQKDANPNNRKRSSHVEVETSQGYEEDSIPKVHQEKATSIQSKYQVPKMSHQHPNHKIRYFNQSMYQKKQMTDTSKNVTSTTNGAQSRIHHESWNTSSSLQEPYKCLTPQKIELGWPDSFTIR
jgi:hypothetical protein